MRISGAFPGNYLKAADLQSQDVKVVMDRIVIEEIGGEHKPVIYFQGHERGLVCNKTNANNIAMAYGDETDDWIGKEVILYTAMVDYQGRSVEAIRVRVPPRRPQNGGGFQHTPTRQFTAPTTGPQEQYTEINPPPHPGPKF